MSDQMVTLRTGEQMLRGIVTVTMLSLDRLLQEQPVAFYELVERARKPDHRFFGNTEQTLRDLSLVESDGRIHDVTRSIVLAGTEGQDFDLHLVSPLRDAQSEIAQRDSREGGHSGR